MIPRITLGLPIPGDLSKVTALVCVHDLRADRRDALELLASDMPAIYGDRLPTLLRGRAVVMGGLTHKIARVLG